MSLRWCVLLCAITVLYILDVNSVDARKSFGGGSHSYPKSGGLSGGGHRYPSSGGLSGGGHGYPSSGGSHGYPSSGGMSGSGGSHGYPSSGGSHGYPSSGGMSGSGGSHGYPSSGGSHGYPSSGGTHGYPSSGGSHGYPSSGGKSGNSHGYPGKTQAGSTHTTTIHNHYHYSPPQQIRYTPVHGGPPVSYPVYRGTPPTYVYQYKDSGSKYGTLLAGLALLNLGTLAGAAYAHSHNQPKYQPQPGEICKFGVKKDNGDYEETKIDCQLITSFIYQEQAKTQNPTNTTVTTTTVTNVTMINSTNGAQPQPAPAVTPVLGNVIYSMLPNGTLVPLNGTAAMNATASTTPELSANNSMTSSVTITSTTTNTTITNALDVKGKPIDVTPGMQCFVIRNTRTSNMRKTVPCGLLKTYADSSIKPNSAGRNAPAFTILAIVFAVCMIR